MHDFSNLTYHADTGITYKLNKNTGYRGSANLFAQDGYLGFRMEAKDQTSSLRATLDKNVFIWDARVDTISSKGRITPNTLTAELNLPDMGQYWQAEGDTNSVRITEKQGAKIELTQQSSSTESERNNRTILDISIPEFYFKDLLSLNDEWRDARFPRDITIKHLIDWKQTVQDVTISRPEEYIEIDSF